jgi:paraquat-inducible protein B
VPSDVAELQATTKRLLAKLDKVPVEEIGEDARRTVASLERTLRRIEERTLPEAETSFASLGRTMGRIDAEIVPEAKSVLEELRKAAAAAEKAVADADRQLLAPDAPGQQELRDALRETARAAKSIRLLADYLERNPSALIRGRSREEPR